MPFNILLGLHHQCPCPHSELQPSPTSPGALPRPLVRSSPGSYGGISLCCVSTREDLCAPSKSGVSVSPSHVEILHSGLTGFQSHMLWGFFVQVPDPQTVLEGYFYVGMSLYSLCVFNIFWCEGCF